MGMSQRAERTPHGRSARSVPEDAKKKKPSIKKVLPQVWSLMAPRKGLIVAGMALMVVNRVAGLVMPYTSKPLLDKVLKPSGDPHLLPRLIVYVFTAMVVQAITSFSLTQLLSKAGQRLIADMRRQVQKHVGLLSVAYYDENRTGTLVARIMTDVEGVRNLVGTGLVDFVGGMLTAVLAFLYLLHRSFTVTLTVFAVMGVFVFVLQYGFKMIRPIFRERGKINAEVTGRLDGVAGRRAGDQGLSRGRARSERVWRGRGAAAGERDEVAHHDQRARRRVDHGAGVGFGDRDVAGRASRAEGYVDGRRLLQLQHVSRLHDCAGLSDREHRHPVDGRVRGAGPHQRNHVGA